MKTIIPQKDYGTCERNLKPYEYLKYLLTEIPKHIEDKDARKTYLDDLLPWSENLPDICKKPT